MDIERLRAGFAELHRHGTFLMPNAWDIGSAKILESLGFPRSPQPARALPHRWEGWTSRLRSMNWPLLWMERIGAAVEAVRPFGVTLTARAENRLYDLEDLDDTITRLRAFREVGADVLYAPGLIEPDRIARFVKEAAAPVNVLLLPAGPTVGELAELGARRFSTGGSLAYAAYGALAHAARELLTAGTSNYAQRNLAAADRAAAFEGDS